MSQITEYISQINTPNYNNQCKYVKKKLLSVISCYISRIIFFKKLHLKLYNLPCYLVGLDIKINEKKQLWFNVWDELHDDAYFNDDKGIIQIKCVKLTDNIYQISVPVINTPIPIISYVKVNYTVYFLKTFFLYIIMVSNVNARYIINNLPYIHLLP